MSEEGRETDIHACTQIYMHTRTVVKKEDTPLVIFKHSELVQGLRIGEGRGLV